MTAPTECPACKADLREAVTTEGGDVWEGSRVIGVYCTQTDRVHCWRCPDCGHEWQRPAATGSRGPLKASARPERGDDGA